MWTRPRAHSSLEESSPCGAGPPGSQHTHGCTYLPPGSHQRPPRNCSWSSRPHGWNPFLGKRVGPLLSPREESGCGVPGRAKPSPERIDARDSSPGAEATTGATAPPATATRHVAVPSLTWREEQLRCTRPAVPSHQPHDQCEGHRAHRHAMASSRRWCRPTACHATPRHAARLINKTQQIPRASQLLARPQASIESAQLGLAVSERACDSTHMKLVVRSPPRAACPRVGAHDKAGHRYPAPSMVPTVSSPATWSAVK